MLYQEYKKKMMKLVRILEIIRNFRALIISVVATICVLTGAFLITKGMVYSTSLENGMLEYGESLEFSANAVFGKVKYEYRYKDPTTQKWGEWSEAPTDQIGEHSVRAVGQNIFSKNRYSKEFNYVITKRNLIVEVSEEKITYGETPTLKADRLAFEDTIWCDEYEYLDKSQRSTEIEPKESAIVIKNSQGVDVTGSYNITHKDGDMIFFEKRPITITIDSDIKNYDGTELKAEGFEITTGNLAFKDFIKVSEYPSQTDVGTTVNDPSPIFVIANEAGLDVTSNYEITVVTGEITVEKRPVIIHTGSLQITYDGKEHSSIEYTVDEETPLVEGDTIVVLESTVIKNVFDGIKNNEFVKIQILDKDGNDVTENYDIDYVYGSLEILKKPLAITTNDNSWVYDGKEHFEIGYTEEGLVEGQILEATDKEIVKTVLAEAIENNVVYKILSGEEDVTENYEITYIYGKINVTKRPITLKSKDFNQIYNDVEFKDERELDVLNTAENEGVANGQTIKPIYIAALVDVGTIENTYDVEIYDGEENVTENYEITKEYGSFTVNKRPIDISGKGATKMYDGRALFSKEYILNSELDIVETHMVKYVSASSALNADDDVINEIEIKIFDKATELIEKTDNYEITYTPNQKLVITPRPITVTAGSTEFVYDGKEKTYDSYTISQDPGVAKGQTAKVVIVGSCKNVLNSPAENTVFSVEIFDKNNQPIKECNYDITIVNGTITILPRPVTFVSNGASKIYDAYPLTLNSAYEEDALDPTNEGVVSGQTVEYTFTGTITDVLWINKEVGSVYNTFDVDIFEGTEKTTSNYIISYKYGSLSVYPRPITFVSESHDKIYDSYSLTWHEADVHSQIDEETNLGLADNPSTKEKQNVYYSFTGTITDVIRLEDNTIGSVKNAFTATIGYGSQDTTSNYTIRYIYGDLTVNPRPIQVISGTSSRVYNGLDLSNTTITISNTAPYLDIVLRHDRYIVSYTIINDVGSVQNVVEIEIYDRYTDIDKTFNYDIDYVYGTLTVTKRNIKIVTDSDEKMYDGTELTCPTYTYDKGYDYGLASGMYGQKIELTVDGKITFVGQTYNTIKQDEYGNDIINIFDGAKNVTSNYNITTEYGILEVTKRPIILTAQDRQKEYDGTPLYGSDPLIVGLEGLGLGDTITATYIGSQTDVGTSPVFIDSFTIMHEGYDLPVNFCYDVQEQNSGILEVIPREITIKADDASKLYDDTPLTASGYEIVSEKTLVLDHYISSISIDGSIIDAGTSNNTPSNAVIRDGNDRNVTFNYDITYLDGTLEVLKRKIKVQTDSAEHLYDDTIFSYNSGRLVSGYGDGVLSTQSATVIVTGAGVDAGFHENTCDVIVVRKSNGSDVSHNYEVEYELGTLTIYPRSIDIYTGTTSKVYDGAPLTYSSYYVDESALLSTHRVVKVNTTGRQLTVGTSKNTAEVTIVRNDSSDVSKNYILNEECYGSLTVTQAMISIKTGSASKPYDGKPLTCPDYEILETSPLVSNHNFVVTTTGTITEIGEAPNTYEFKAYLGDIDVTDCFEFSPYEVLGTLEITKPQFVVESFSDEKYYNGIPLEYHRAFLASGVLKTGHKLKYTFTGSALDVMFDENGEVTSTPNLFTAIVVDENGNDVTAEYGEITYIYGELKVLPVEIEIEAKNDIKEYDGTPLYSPLEIVEPNPYLEDLNQGFLSPRFTWEVLRPSAERTEVGITEYVIAADDFQIYFDGQPVPMTNFIIYCQSAEIRVVEKLLTVNLWDYTKTYDGKPVSYQPFQWYILPENNPDGVKAEIQLEGSITEVGSIDIAELAFDLYDAGKIKIYKDGVDVTINYAVKFEAKVPLTVNKRSIEITVASAQKVYDGKELTAHSYDVTGLAKGHYIVNEGLQYTGLITEVGTDENSIDIDSIVIRDENNNDVTKNYNIDIKEGKLTVIENNK